MIRTLRARHPRRPRLAPLLTAFLLWAARAAAAQAEPLSLTEVVLVGLHPPRELQGSPYRPEGSRCVEDYLQAVSREPRLAAWKPPAGPEQAVAARRRNLELQMTALLGRPVRQTAKEFAEAVPLRAEWEGLSEGPIDEADLAGQWLERSPDTPMRPFLHLFMAHRYRAAHEASLREHAKALTPILARRYREHLAAARGSAVALIACIAGDLEAQPHVYLPGFPRP
jgi:hypothetical protein